MLSRSDPIVAVIVDAHCDDRRSIRDSEARAINAGRLASPNLYCSLDARAREILVRVFEKHGCHERVERSMMLPAKYEVRALVGFGAESGLSSLPGRSGAAMGSEFDEG